MYPQENPRIGYKGVCVIIGYMHYLDTLMEYNLLSPSICYGCYYTENVSSGNFIEYIEG
jgi:hypothetical protein